MRDSNEGFSDQARENYIFARISTRKQMDNISRQIEFFGRPEYAEHLLVQDFGSGINFKGKRLSAILDASLQGTIGEVVIA